MNGLIYTTPGRVQRVPHPYEVWATHRVRCPPSLVSAQSQHSELPPGHKDISQKSPPDSLAGLNPGPLHPYSTVHNPAMYPLALSVYVRIWIAGDSQSCLA
jgi:hypothetical protein